MEMDDPLHDMAISLQSMFRLKSNGGSKVRNMKIEQGFCRHLMFSSKEAHGLGRKQSILRRRDRGNVLRWLDFRAISCIPAQLVRRTGPIPRSKWFLIAKELALQRVQFNRPWHILILALKGIELGLSIWWIPLLCIASIKARGRSKHRSDSSISSSKPDGDSELLQILTKLNLCQEDMLNQLALDRSFLLFMQIGKEIILPWRQQREAASVACPPHQILFLKMVEEII